MYIVCLFIPIKTFQLIVKSNTILSYSTYIVNLPTLQNKPLLFNEALILKSTSPDSFISIIALEIKSVTNHCIALAITVGGTSRIKIRKGNKGNIKIYVDKRQTYKEDTYLD